MNYKMTILITCALLSFATSIYGQTFKKYEKSIHDISYSINPKLELFNVIAMQMGQVPMSLSNLSYKQQSIERFKSFKNHEAISTLIETAKNGWGIDDPIMFILHLNDDFSINSAIDEAIVKRGGGIEQLNKLAKALKKFVMDSDFQTYFNEEQQSFYDQVLINVSYAFRNFKAVETLEDYYGSKANSYNLILNVIGGYGNFGKQIKNNDTFDLYAVVETTQSNADLPIYEPSVSTTELIFHEFTHGFVNPITDEKAEILEQTKHLLDPIKRQMRVQAYTSWSVAANEHIVRAAVVRLLAYYYSEELAKNIHYNRYLSRDFIYADTLLSKLRSYEVSRDTFKNLSSYSNQIIAAFSEIDQSYIESALYKVEALKKFSNFEIPKPYNFTENDGTLFIVSTNEEDTKAQEDMVAYVNRYKNMISEKSQIITDKEALQMDVSNYDVIVFGTMQGNLFLKKYGNEIPITITENFIVTNKIIEGEHLQLVTSWVHPLNTEKAMIIYTAQQIQDIANFHFSPSKDMHHYWVAQNLIPIDKGDYKKYYDVWMPSWVAR